MKVEVRIIGGTRMSRLVRTKDDAERFFVDLRAKLREAAVGLPTDQDWEDNWELFELSPPRYVRVKLALGLAGYKLTGSFDVESVDEMDDCFDTIKREVSIRPEVI